MNDYSFLATTAESHSHSVLDAMPHMIGMLMVMVALAFLWGVCVLTAKVISVILSEKQDAKSPMTRANGMIPDQSPPARPSVTSDSDPRIAPEIVAVIAAAIAAVSRNQAVRIVSIKPMSTSWERAGRQSVLTSHRIR